MPIRCVCSYQTGTLMSRRCCGVANAYKEGGIMIAFRTLQSYYEVERLIYSKL